MQLTADVFARPAERARCADAAALGAAIVAAAGTGLHADVAAAARAMVRPGERFLPDPDASRTYDRLYRDVYLALYGRLRPLYDRIRRITGYPP